MKDESPCHPSYTYLKKNDSTTYVSTDVCNINHTKKHLQNSRIYVATVQNVFVFSTLSSLKKNRFPKKNHLKIVNCRQN